MRSPQRAIQPQQMPDFRQAPLGTRIWKHRSIYLFILPAFVWFLVFCYYPMYGLLLAFKDYKYSKGILGSAWVGLKWFRKFMADPSFWQVVMNTLKISVMKLLFTFPVPVILALMMNSLKRPRFKRVIQTISYMPHFVSWVVVAAMMQKIFSPYGGMVNEIRQALDPGAKAVYYLGKPKYFYWFVILSDIWKGCGWGTIIYLAALSGIDPSLYEAAVIDGARPMQMVARITLPLMYPTICIMLIMNLGNILNVGYEQLLQIQTTPTEHLAEVIDTYVIRKGLTSGSHSYATAIGLTKSVITLFLVVTVNRISDRFSGISLF